MTTSYAISGNLMESLPAVTGFVRHLHVGYNLLQTLTKDDVIVNNENFYHNVTSCRVAIWDVPLLGDDQ